jgi:hypothetical protein
MFTSPTLAYHQAVVEGMMDAGDPFGLVEDFINDAASIEEDAKAALWLLAWSSRDSWTQRRDVLAMLGGLAGCRAMG